MWLGEQALPVYKSKHLDKDKSRFCKGYLSEDLCFSSEKESFVYNGRKKLLTERRQKRESGNVDELNLKYGNFTEDAEKEG